MATTLPEAVRMRGTVGRPAFLTPSADCTAVASVQRCRGMRGSRDEQRHPAACKTRWVGAVIVLTRPQEAAVARTVRRFWTPTAVYRALIVGAPPLHRALGWSGGAGTGQATAASKRACGPHFKQAKASPKTAVAMKRPSEEQGDETSGAGGEGSSRTVRRSGGRRPATSVQCQARRASLGWQYTRANCACPHYHSSGAPSLPSKVGPGAPEGWTAARRPRAVGPSAEAECLHTTVFFGSLKHPSAGTGVRGGAD